MEILNIEGEDTAAYETAMTLQETSLQCLSSSIRWTKKNMVETNEVLIKRALNSLCSQIYAGSIRKDEDANKMSLILPVKPKRHDGNLQNIATVHRNDSKETLKTWKHIGGWKHWT